MWIFISALLVFLLGLFAWSAQRDHDALIDASLTGLITLDAIVIITTPFGNKDIDKNILHLLNSFEKEVKPYTEDLKKDIWKLKLLGYESIASTIEEYDLIVNTFLEDLLKAKMLGETTPLQKYQGNQEIRKQISDIQKNILSQARHIIDHPYRSKFCKLIGC